MKTSRSASAGARKRQAAPPPPPEAEEELPEPAADAPTYQTFTVRFLVDPSGACRRTEVTHVQAGASEAWAGDDEARLSRWIAERIRPAAPAEPAEPAAPRPLTLALRDLQILSAGEAGSEHSLIAAGQTLRARLALDLPEVEPGRPPVGYAASLYAHSLRGGSTLLAEARGSAAGPTAVEWAARSPGPGIYRISAAVALAAPDSGSATATGGLLHVYDQGDNR